MTDIKDIAWHWFKEGVCSSELDDLTDEEIRSEFELRWSDWKHDMELGK